MNNFRNSDTALLLLRLVFGAAMIYGHGWGKLTRLLGDEPIKFADPFGFGPEASLVLVVIAEVLCAALLMAGLFTRYVTIPLIITMAVVVFIAHIDDPFNRMEKGVLYLAAYLSLFLMGPGKYSLDTLIRKR